MIKDYLNKKKDKHKVEPNKEDRKKFIADRKRKKILSVKTITVDELYVTCKSCGHATYHKEIVSHNYTCPHCDSLFKISARERINLIVDEGKFEEFGILYKTKNWLHFPDYDKKIKGLQESTGLTEAVVTGFAEIEEQQCVFIVMDSSFLMGSMGSVVGHKITKAFEKATRKKLPVVLFAASGGARMQEGLISLMQMAKTSAAVANHSKKKLLYIPVLTNPTYGGVTASFAMLGDIILAEPKAMIGFAGQRVIKDTIKQDLPEGFQTSEFLLEKGYIDKIIPRNNMKKEIANILKLHNGGIK